MRKAGVVARHSPKENPYINRKQYGWGLPQPLRLDYSHASMAAIQALQGCLPVGG